MKQKMMIPTIVVVVLVLAGVFLYTFLNQPEKNSVQVLREQLATGTPEQKEEVLNVFMANNTPELVPNVIEAILDNTASPIHDDTGWGNIYHQAATAMSQFAYKVDGISIDERGKTEFSFYNDVGTANEQRRKEVHDNWLNWYEHNKDKV